MSALVLDYPHSLLSSLFGRYYEKVESSPMRVLPADETQLVVFSGGEDVGTNPERDAHEAMVYAEALDRGIPMVGICRGAQFLHVMNGGVLHQHVEGHLGGHSITTHKGTRVPVTSTHHQMLNMGRSRQHQLIAWASIVGDKDPEVVHYPDTNVLCVQFHPEFAQHGSPCRRYFDLLLNNFLFGEL